MQATPRLGLSPRIFYQEPSLETEGSVSLLSVYPGIEEDKGFPSPSPFNTSIFSTKGASEEKLLMQRLTAYLGREKDLLGETLAHLQAESSLYTSEEKSKLTKLLPALKLPWFIVAEEQRKEIVEQGISVASYPRLQPFHKVLAAIVDTIASITTSSFKDKLKILEAYYTNFITQLLESSSLREREALLALKAQVCGDSVGFLLLDINKARAMLSIDELGLPCRTNTHGRHAVASLEGLHCKANPTAAVVSDYLNPAWEYAVTSLTQAFSPTSLIAAPTSFLKISNVLTFNWQASLDQEAKKAFKQQLWQGKTSQQIFKDQPELKEKLCKVAYLEARTVQVGYTIGHANESIRPQAILLADLISVLEMFDLLCDERLLTAEEVIESWPFLLKEVHKSYPSNPHELFRAYKTWMEQLPEEQLLSEFSSKGEFGLKSEEQGLRAFHEDYLKSKEENNFWQLLALLKLHPKLASKASLASLIDLPLALRWIAKLFPGKSIGELFCLIPPLLKKIDKEAFSSLVIASLLILPNDGKADNYIIELIWKDQEIESLRLACIDNDRAFEPAIIPAKQGHGIHLKCLPLLLKGCMSQPIANSVKEFILNLSPRDFLLQWIQQLDQRNQQYQRLIHQKNLTKEDFLDEAADKKLDIPLLLPKGLLSTLFTKLQLLQDKLKQDHVTHYDLFQALEPTAFACYQVLMQRHANPLDALLALHRQRTNVEALLEPTTLTATDTLPFLVPLEEEASDFLAALNWSAPIPTLLDPLKIVSDLSFCPRLPLSLMQKQNFLLIAIQLGKASLVKLALHLGAKANHADEAGQTALHKLMRTYDSPHLDEGQVFSIADLLLAQEDTNPNAVDDQHSPPLFPLINRAIHAPTRFSFLLAKLVSKGADLEYPDHFHQGRTPLEKAIADNNLLVFIELAKKGAGVKTHPARILEFAKMHAQNSELGKALHLLEAQLPAFAYLRSLALFTLPRTGQGFEWEGVDSGRAKLHPLVMQQLPLNAALDFIKLPRTHGRSAVVAVSYLHRKLHFKPHPEMAGREYAVGSLHRVLIGHGTPETELFKCYNARRNAYPLLVSETSEGQNLDDALKAGNTLADLDLHRVHNMMLLAMLVNPEDGKPDNYILQSFINHQGEQKEQLVCVDNDHALIPSFSTEGKLQVKCILFCLNQMQEALHPKTREHFLQIDPLEILRTWLANLDIQQQRYTKLFTEEERDFAYAYHKQNPVISILLPPRTVAKIYQKLTRLQRALNNNLDLTPLELLIRLDPPLGKYYEHLLQDTNAPIYSRFLKGPGQFYEKSLYGLVTSSTSHSLLKSSNMPTKDLVKHEARYIPKEALKELQTLMSQSHPNYLRAVAAAIQKGNIAPFHELLTDDLRENALAFIDISQQKQELALLKAMTSSSFETLSLHHCQSLTEALLKNLIVASAALNKLDASHCSSLKSVSFPELSCLTHLNLSSCPHLYKLSLKAPKLRFLILKNNQALSSLQLDAPLLEELELEGCLSLSAKQIQAFVKSCPHLKRITLAGCDLSSLPYYKLIHQHPLLIRYSLENFSSPVMEQLQGLLNNSLNKWCSKTQRLPYEELSALLDGLRINKSLVHLSLKAGTIDNEGSIALAKALKTNTSLTKLLLSSDHIRKEGASALGKVLEINASITKLNFRYNEIGKEGASSLAKALETNTSLTELDLSGNEIGYEGTSTLSKALKTNTSLTKLKLRSNRIGYEGTSALSKALETNISLTVLDLYNDRIGYEGARALAKALETNTSLTELDLSGNEIGYEGTSALSKALETNISLTKLNLSSNKIGKEGASSLAKALETNTSLTELELSENEIGYEGTSALSKALETNASLTALSLSRNKIGYEGTSALSKALETNTSLTELDLSGNEIGYEGTSALSKALETNISLTKLNLSSNKIGKEGASALSKALETNNSLTLLVLNDNQIGYEAASALGKALETNHSLTILNLKGNEIGLEGASALAKALETNNSLTTLDLYNNEIAYEVASPLAIAEADRALAKAEGASALAKALETNHSLTALDLYNHEIGSEGASALGKALEKNTSLTKLNLRSNRIGYDGFSALSKALETNTSLTELNLSGKNFTNYEAIKALAKALETNTSLTSLGISWNINSKNPTLAFIRESLRKNQTQRQPLEGQKFQAASLAKKLNSSHDKKALKHEVNYLPQADHTLSTENFLPGERRVLDSLSADSVSLLALQLWNVLNGYFASSDFQEANDEIKRTTAHFQIQLLDLQHCDYSLFSQQKLQQAQSYLINISSYLAHKKIISPDYLLTGEKENEER
jgi:Ran GTPase-activating protein (RanGAP) involved in mRNA processing and transport